MAENSSEYTEQYKHPKFQIIGGIGDSVEVRQMNDIPDLDGWTYMDAHRKELCGKRGYIISVMPATSETYDEMIQSNVNLNLCSGHSYLVRFPEGPLEIVMAQEFLKEVIHDHE